MGIFKFSDRHISPVEKNQDFSFLLNGVNSLPLTENISSILRMINE